VNLLLRDGDAVEERPPGHALVRVRVVRRDEPLVAPPDVPRGPVEVERGEPLVDDARRRAAGEGDREPVAPARAVGDPAGAQLG
jgi:hypothetical protein